MPDSTVPMAASTVHGSPGQVTAASPYKRSIRAGIGAVAAAPGPPPPSEAMPAPSAPASSTTISTSLDTAIPAARSPVTGPPRPPLCRPRRPPNPQHPGHGG